VLKRVVVELPKCARVRDVHELGKTSTVNSGEQSSGAKFHLLKRLDQVICTSGFRRGLDLRSNK
jgi:hypothetical protein